MRKLENVIRRLSLMVEFSDFDMDNIDYKSFIDGMGNYEKEYSLKINMNNNLKGNNKRS